MNTFKEISSKWRPKRIKLLLIGESPPAQEKNYFFYAPNSDLYNFTKKAFENVYKDKINEYSTFLNFFMDLGCFLDDLCEEPINYIKDKNLRKREWQDSVQSLKRRFIKYHPLITICIMIQIQEYVQEAIQQSVVNTKYLQLPFPAFNKKNINNYIAGLSEILKSLRKEKILD